MKLKEVKYQEFNSFSRKWCIERTKDMLSSSFSFFFREHPRTTVSNYDEYLLVIKNPMWFKEVLDRLTRSSYIYVHEWIYDMESIWNNAFTYNAKNTQGYDSALVLQRYFNKYCVPVPSSQKSLVGIKRYKILQKLSRTLLNPPQMIKRLQWDVPEIDSDRPSIGDDIVFGVQKAIFNLDPETKAKLFAHPAINEVFNNPKKSLKDVSLINEDNVEVQAEKNSESDVNE